MKTIRHFILPAALLLMMITNGCFDEIFIDGNGMPQPEGRVTRPFAEVALSGDFMVYITTGDDYEIVVDAESNLLPYIETDVRGNTLHIGTQGIHTLVNHSPIKVFITLPVLEGINVSGSGTVITDQLITGKIDLLVSGSGKIEAKIDSYQLKSFISGSGKIIVSGNSDNADLSISGSGRLAADNLMLSNCEASISGSGEMSINVEKLLIVSISGSGNVVYAGRPVVETHISGSGRLISKN